MGELLGLGETLLHDPDRVTDPALAYRIMSYGMRNGSFRRNHRLSDHIHGNHCDYFSSRLIVNGVNDDNRSHVRQMAEEAEYIEEILVDSAV